MGFYSKHVLPRVTEWILDKPKILEMRRETTRGLRGEVVEIGFGSGLNLDALPPEVERLHAIDPDQTGRMLAAERLARTDVDVRFAGLDGRMLALDPASMDCALSTWTMCSIPELQRALAELRRVLKPGGTLHFMEHGLSENPKIARRQRWITPFYRPIAGGCRLDLPVEQSIRDAGFEIRRVESFDLGKPGVTTWVVRGVAVNP